VVVTGQILMADHSGPAEDTSGAAHVILWHNGALTDPGTLGRPGTVTFTQAVSISNNGQIAGSGVRRG
jgi:uncharacterized membrane protein